MLPCSKPFLGFSLFALFFSFNFVISLSTVSNGATSVYDILSDFGLPSGLLPDSVKDYSLSEDGRFVVELPKPCYVKFEYLVYYDKKITGKLKYGSISDLKGIEVQRFFLWLNVNEIKVDSPDSLNINFKVGIINKKLDISQFETVHSCRDGVSCHGSWKNLVKVPTPVNEIPMLVTE